MEIRFVPNSGGYHDFKGKGSNTCGSYAIMGMLTRDGIITMCCKFWLEDRLK